MSGYAKPEMLFLLVFLVPAAVAGWMAANRARNIFVWTAVCAFFPIFLLVLYFKKPLRQVEGKFRLCRSCGEFAKWKESSCLYCKAPFEPKEQSISND